MTKEERIKEAYGVLYDSNKHRINFDGWFNNEGETDYLTFGDTKQLGDCEYSGEYIFRPKSLQGIENNNGWVKIESEDDLPKEDNVGYMVCKNTDMLFNTSITKSTVIYLYNTGKITHYQPIVKPEPPLY